MFFHAHSHLKKGQLVNTYIIKVRLCNTAFSLNKGLKFRYISLNLVITVTCVEVVAGMSTKWSIHSKKAGECMLVMNQNYQFSVLMLSVPCFAVVITKFAYMHSAKKMNK